MDEEAEPVARVPVEDAGIEYKVVELSVVTDVQIERTLNDTMRLGEGWQFDSLHFSMWEGSRRPSMAFLIFVRHPSSPSPGADA